MRYILLIVILILFTNTNVFANLDNATPFENARAEVYSKIPISKNEIIFIWDSITEWFPIDKYIKNRNILVMGISWNESIDIKERILNIASRKPKKIFLMIGANDLRLWASEDILFENMKEIVSIIRKNSRQTKIYLESILPTGWIFSGMMPRIIKYNNLMKDYSRKEWLGYIDIYQYLYNDGFIKDSFSYDWLHLTSKGYIVWKIVVQKYILN